MRVRDFPFSGPLEYSSNTPIFKCGFFEGISCKINISTFINSFNRFITPTLLRVTTKIPSRFLITSIKVTADYPATPMLTMFCSTGEFMNAATINGVDLNLRSEKGING